MDKIVCPNCQTSIRVQTVVVADAAPANVRTRPLMAFLRSLGPGRFTMRELDRAYEGWRLSPDGIGAPAMSPRSLAFELDRLGFQRYRTAQYRGFVITATEEAITSAGPMTLGRSRELDEGGMTYEDRKEMDHVQGGNPDEEDR